MKHTLRIFLVLGVIVLCLSSIDGGMPRLSSTVMADTCMVGGVISTNTTWSAADCDTYVVYGNLLVDQGATLTIMQGVVVAVMQGFRIEVRGALKARGATSDSIVFTSYKYPPYAGDWESIKFRNASIDSACSLQYSRIEYSQRGVYCDTASPTISHCLIRTTSQSGVEVTAGSPKIIENRITQGYVGMYIKGGSPTTYGNVIQSNSYGMLVYGEGSTIEADTIKLNTLYGIYIPGTTVTATITSCEISDNASSPGIFVQSYNGDIAIHNNVISGNKGGIVSTTPYSCNFTIKNNWISGNKGDFGGAIYINSDDGSITIDSNCIMGNSATGMPVAAGGIYLNGGDIYVRNNDIVGNSNRKNLVFEVYSGTGVSSIQGQNNWWGTTNSDSISLLIYDYYDNFDLRKFIFTPFATLPHCTTITPSIKVTTPNGRECWPVSTTKYIKWDYSFFSDSVIIEYTINNGATWDTIMDTTTNDGVYPWIIPNTPSDSCLIRISHVGDNSPSDTSDNVFSIVPWIRGDANADCAINSADVSYLINYLFVNGPAPQPWQAGDANCDGTINSADVAYLINYLFVGGPAPGC
jgi:hypothetical protein